MSHVGPNDPAMPKGPDGRCVSWFIISTIHAQHAFDPANDTANGSADDGTDWSSAAVALIRAVGNAARNALRLRSNRYRDDRNDCGRNQNS